MWTSPNVCIKCIADPYLCEVMASVRGIMCTYCGEYRPGLAVEDLAERCGAVIQSTFRDLNASKSVSDHVRRPYGLTLSEVLGKLLNGPSRLLEDLEDMVYEAWISGNTYEPSFAEGPETSKHTLSLYQTLLAFLQPQGAAGMSSQHDGISKIFDEICCPLDSFVSYYGRSAVLDVGPGYLISNLYVARALSGLEAVEAVLSEPEIQLTAAGQIPALAIEVDVSSSGDDNKSIPLFHGFTHLDGAIANARPWAGSLVVTSEFKIQRHLCLLDLNQFAQMPSVTQRGYFAPERIIAGQRCAFFREMNAHLSAPLSADCDGIRVIEALASYYSCAGSISIEGVIYPSVQSLINATSEFEYNVVLFGEAGQVIKPAESSEPALVYSWELTGDFQIFAPRIWPRQSSFLAENTCTQGSLALNRHTIDVHHVHSVLTRSEKVRVDYQGWE